MGRQNRIFMYPKNGQTQEQQSTDRRECQQWAAEQVGAANGRIISARWWLHRGARV